MDDLLGVVQEHIGKLRILNAYTQTITLTQNGIVVDVLDMDGGTITCPAMSGAGLYINQRTNGLGGYRPATIFEASTWTRGTITCNILNLVGEALHPATLNIGSAGNTLTLGGTFMRIGDQFSTVNWVAGNVTVNPGLRVINQGNFFADSAQGTMGNNLGVGNTWRFTNNRNLTLRRPGIFQNVNPDGNGTTFVPMSMGPGQFEIDGTFAQDAGATTAIESGTLLVVGTFTQNDGDVTVDAGATITVTGDYTQSAGTVTDIGSLTVGGQYLVKGGTFSLVAGYIQAKGGVQLAYGAELSGSGIIAGGFSNAGTIDVGGIGATGTLNISGDYTQLASGVLNVEILNNSAGNYDVLAVSGLATLDGTLNVNLLAGYQINPGEVYSVLTYSARSGAFAYINYPSYFDPRYDDPKGTFSLWVLVGSSSAPFQIVHRRR
jgi:hypothetical protein